MTAAVFSNSFQISVYCRDLLSAIEYDGQLSAEAYIILAVISLTIIAGLGWCFYRAITTERDESEQIQHPDDIGDENR